MSKLTVNDKAFCDTMNLAVSRQLQSYAALLVIDSQSQAIIQYSENASMLLKTSNNRLNTHEVTYFLTGSDASNDIDQWLCQSDKRYRRFTWQGDESSFPVWVYIHQQPSITLLEIELVDTGSLEEDAFFVVDEIANLNVDKLYKSSEDCATEICKKLAQITRYERTIIYRFNDDSSGVVIGEALDDGMESYLGLRFPDTDIPEPVRALYLEQPLRYIPDITYTPIGLIPKCKHRVDLSVLTLRAVSPIHIDYLRNMGVSSSLSVAIIYNNSLWGLIAFHHRQPKTLSPQYRLGLLLLAKNVARTLVMIDETQRFKDAQDIFQRLHSVQSIIYKESSLITAFKKTNSELLKLFSAQGVAYCHQDIVHLSGLTPTKTQVKSLVNWIVKEQKPKIFSTNTLPEEYPPSSQFDTRPCGLLAIPISHDDKHFLLIFRPMFVTQVSWGGDPSHVLTVHNKDYSPRKSFSIWKETVNNQSDNWKAFELSAGDTLCQTLVNKFMQHLLHKQAMMTLRHKEETKKNSALRAKEAELEIKVLKRSHELSIKNKSLSDTLEQLNALQDNIIQTAKMTTIGQLAAGIAHEINNPLSYVLNNVYLLEKYFGLIKTALNMYSQIMDDLSQNLSHEHSKQCQAIISFNQEHKIFTKLDNLDHIFSETIEGSIRIKQIVSGLTAFSGGAHEESEIVDVNELIEAAVNITENELKYKAIVIKNLSIVPKLRVSPRQLELVFVNLLLNAAQSIETKGEIHVSSSLSNMNVLVTISDTGCGISPENIPKLFTPFFTTKPIGSATGLGLANAYGFITNLGGKITVKTKVGRGSTFAVFLPVNTTG